MLTKLRMFLIMGIAFTCFAAPLLAQGSKGKRPKKARASAPQASSSGGGYGVAGCGLGSLAIGPKPGFMQVFASTTNGTFGSQTFGISTGTSNCDLPQMSMAAASFIEVNKEIVNKEGARGNGESIENLAHIYQCADSAYFGNKIQEEYEMIFATNQNSFDISRAITEVIRNDSRLASTCSPSLIKG